ncbi:MAG: sulfatase, partial [Candidatus Aenigmatarchaeota archaeon]
SNLFRKGQKYIDKSIGKIFVWFHLPEVHQGWSPPKSFSGLFSKNISSNVSSNQMQKEFAQLNLTEEDIKYIRARYDEELKYVDYEIGKFLKELKSKDIYDDSLLIITSDHGEDLMEHGHIGHGLGLQEVLVNIPLLIKFPNNRFEGKNIEEPVSLKDIFPTISDLTGYESRDLKGISLIDIIKGKSTRQSVTTQKHGEIAIRTKNLKFLLSNETSWINKSGHYNLERHETPILKFHNLTEDPIEKN